MYAQQSYLLAVDGSDAIIMPLLRAADPADTPCTFHNATDRTIQLWHWQGTGKTWEDPCVVHSLAVGESAVIHYPGKFYVRATSWADDVADAIDESVVGDIPRHVVLVQHLVPSRSRAMQDSLT